MIIYHVINILYQNELNLIQKKMKKLSEEMLEIKIEEIEEIE